MEINSSFAFWLAGGVGASYFVTDNMAFYGGYRLIHVSNGHTSDPNRGFEADTGVAGVTFFFQEGGDWHPGGRVSRWRASPGVRRRRARHSHPRASRWGLGGAQPHVPRIRLPR